jgi:hypothetical protein
MKKFIFLLTAVALALVVLLSSANTAPAQTPYKPEQPDLTINAAARSEVIEAAIKTLDAYVFPDVAKQIQADIRTQLKNREYDSITSATKLAQTLTSQIQAVSHDKHLNVFYSHELLPATDEQGEPSTPEAREKLRQSDAWQNFGFQKIERLDGNIGYLDLRGFLPPKDAGDVAISAMNFLSNTKALIIDLRQNGGGDPDMIALISTYLFGSQLVHLNDLYWREPNASGKYRERVEQHWTLPYVPGQRYLSKDVYVLTSKNTFSAAEEFTYNLKQLKRATIIGEATGGGANPGRFQRFNDHFGMFVATGRAVNPITKTNWEGTGVQPDVKVSAELALKTAHLAAMQKVLAKTTEPEFVDELKKAIKNIQKEAI